MTQSYLLLDPQHEHAVALIQAIYQRTKLRPVCLYPSRLQEIYRRKQFPLLRSGMVEARYFLDTGTLPQLIKTLRKRHDIIGIVPHQEQSLERAAELVAALELPWNEPALLRLIRDKHGIKEYLRNHHPHLPVTASRLVRNANDVFNQPLPQRFVIKPNHGWGGRDVAFFHAHTPRAQVAAYFAHNRGPCVLEEVVGGREYAVRGQMDAVGHAHVLHVVEYERVAANNKPNVLHRTHHVARHDGAFAEVSAYASQVMEALGLRRCPFHMDVMLTVHGPRLIDVGATLGGLRNAYGINTVHGGDFNVFAMAGHHYLFDSAFDGPREDWEHYDRIRWLHLDAIATRDSRVFRLEGLDAVQMMPEFLRWIGKPHVGERIRRTVDELSAPYSLQLRTYGSQDELVQASEHVKRLVQINRAVSGSRRLQVTLMAELKDWQLRGRFWVSRALGVS